jgi:hypothetical protein
MIDIYIPDAMSSNSDDFSRTVHADYRPEFAFGFEEPRQHFVGRKKELNELKAALSCDNKRPRWHGEVPVDEKVPVRSPV